MNISNLNHKLISLYRLGIEIARLPAAHLHFHSQPSPEYIHSVYQNFVKPHPKYKLFKNKSLGAALIDLRSFESDEAFLASLRRCGRALAERRRALARGHQLRSIDRNEFVEEIHQINVSSEMRQGRPMAAAYMQKETSYKERSHFRYYGVFDASGRLVGYCNIGIFGNFALIDRVIGYRNTDGAMYLLITEIAATLVTEQKLDYFMYDTMFGALPGMQDFKRRLGFRAYRARYSIE